MPLVGVFCKPPRVLVAHHTSICDPLSMGKTFHTKLQPVHGTKFGIKFTTRHPGSDEVSSAICQFYVTLGIEDKVCGKRKATANVN